jgi:hypothetical protein
MDVGKIREQIEGAEALIERLQTRGELEGSARAQAWKAAAIHVAVAGADANHARVRGEDQLFIRDLVVARCEQLTRELHEVEL